MSAIVLDGAAFAAEIRAGVARQVPLLTNELGPPRLCAVLVGSDPGARLYADSQQRTCEQLGIKYERVELPEDVTQDTLHHRIDELNLDPRITGIILQLPLPRRLDASFAQYRIDPYKDVEGINPANIGLLFYGDPIIAPCTALAVNELLQRSGTPIRGAHAVVIGQSRIVGKPVTMSLLAQEATVTSCHIATRNLAEHARQADILIVAIGQPNFIGPRYVKPGATVIDVGINRVTERDADGREVRRTVGDVDFEAVRAVAGAITPVPGGVGPLTVAMLLRNTVEAARKQLTRSL